MKYRKLKIIPTGWAPAALLILVVVSSLTLPMVLPFDANVGDLSVAPLSGPNATHWLGTDDLGRDILSRIVVGVSVSLTAGLIAVSIAGAIGIPFGLIAGLMGGWLDNVLSRISDALLSFPPLVLAITVVGVFGPSLTNAMIAIGIVYAPRVFRIARAAAMTISTELYVTAAVALGATKSRILREHVLPNTISPLVIETGAMLSLAIIAEASLSFLGLGAPPPTPSLGRMLADLRTYWGQIPWAVVAVSLALILLVTLLNITGDRIRDRYVSDRAVLR